MFIVTKGMSFSASIPVINANNSMGTGKTVAYKLVNADDDSVAASGNMTESSEETGLYYVNLTISTTGSYRLYITCEDYPKVTVDLRVTEEEIFITDIHDETQGKWVIDETVSPPTLTLYRSDGVTILKTFTLGTSSVELPSIISRTPQ
jgi:hypothetical protein